MARIQILELPEGAGDERAPFILVIDQAPTDEPYLEAFRRDLSESDIAARTGARAVLVFEDTIEITANQVTLDDGQTVRLQIERDFAAFREQAMTEIARVQADLAESLKAGRIV